MFFFFPTKTVLSSHPAKSGSSRPDMACGSQFADPFPETCGGFHFPPVTNSAAVLIPAHISLSTPASQTRCGIAMAQGACFRLH